MNTAILFLLAYARRRATVLAGLAACLAICLAVTAAHAQVLPRHYDPNLRQSTQSPPSIPALRFLTVADYPPFNYRDPDGNLVGYNVDLAEAICADLSTNCTLQAWPWDQAADALADNQGDALIGGLALTDKTAAEFSFSAIYLRFPGRFVVPRDAVADFAPDQLTGQRVAVRANSRHAALMERYLPDSLVIGADTEFAALELVKLGEADVFFGDGLRASFWLGENIDCCDFAGDAYFRPDYFGEGLAIAVGPNREEVTTAINFALNRLAKSGKMDELYLRWFPIGFY